MIANVKDYGAQGDGVADDTVAIRNAVAALSSGGIVFFPPGNYKVNSLSTGSGSTWTPGPRSIEIPSNVSIQGSGVNNTRVFRHEIWSEIPNDLPPRDYRDKFWGIFIVPYSSPTRVNISFSDMTIDGGYLEGSEPTGGDFKNYYGIELRSTSNISIKNVRIINSPSDGLTISSGTSGTPPSTDVLVDECSFDVSWRFAIGLGRNYRNVILRRCTFRNWQHFAIKAEREFSTIDDENLDRGLTITRCTCLPPTTPDLANTGSISIYNGGHPQYFRDTTISHNTLRGLMRFRGAHNTLIEGNTILHSSSGPALDLWGRTIDFTARHNTFRLESGSCFRAWYGIEAQTLDLVQNGQIVFAFNTVEWVGTTPPGSTQGRAVDLISVHDAVVEGNILRGAPSGSPAWATDIPAIRVVPGDNMWGDFPLHRVTLTHNIVERYPIGIQLHDPTRTSGQVLTDVIAAHNLLDGCLKGIQVNQPELIQRLMLGGNGVVQPPVGSTSLDWGDTPITPYLIGGVHGQDAVSVGFFVGQGPPASSAELRVQNAAVGSLYLDSTPTGGQLWMRQKKMGTPLWTITPTPPDP